MIETPSLSFLQTLFSDFHAEKLNVFQLFLEQIQCPENLRGYSIVHSAMHRIRKDCPRFFGSVFPNMDPYFDEMTQQLNNNKGNIGNIFYEQKKGLNWLSERPIYSLLFIFDSYHDKKLRSYHLLFFLNHFFKNESLILSQSREYHTTKAFRKICTTDSFNSGIMHGTTPASIANNLESALEQAKTNKNPTNMEYSDHIRQLIHFYRLDWKAPRRRQATSRKSIRRHYSSKRLELIIGTENLFTYALNPKSSDGDLCHFEDYRMRPMNPRGDIISV